jgi:hypothetical protein
MKKMLIFGAAAIAALLPAGIGLAANPSFSARVPLAPAQVRLVTSDRSPTPSPTATPSPGRSDDHGGNRPKGVSDDPPGDDHGGNRSDNKGSHNKGGDDKGGDNKGGHGNDGAGHDVNDG